MATTPSPHPPYGRFVGRIGAFAVSLGVGVAIASSPAIAWAEGGDPSPSQGSPDSGPATSGPVNSGPAAPAGGPSSPSGTPPVTPNQSTSSSSALTVSPTNPFASLQPQRSRANEDDTASSLSLRTNAFQTLPTGTSRLADTLTNPKLSTVALRTLPDPDGPGNGIQTAAALTTTSQPALAAQLTSSVLPVSPPPTPQLTLTGLVSNVLSVFGFGPQATNAPAAPAQHPLLWTLLGWVRREFENAFAPTPPTAATPFATTQTITTLAVSPLGTPQQLEAEKIAAQTANTLPVQLMKLVLGLGWFGDANSKFQQVGGVDQENIDQLGEAVNEYAMGAAFQQQILNSNDPTVVMQVAPPHDWYDQDVPGSRILYDNPDTIYRFMGVNNASTYVLKGRFTGDMPADTTFSVLTGLSGTTASVLSGRDLELGPDNSFTITVNGLPTAPGEKNHLQLTNDSTLIAVRNTLSNWNNQDPMSLSIERVSGPPNSLFSQLGGFAIPLIGPAVVGNPLLTTLVSLVPPLPVMPPLLRGAVTSVVMALGLSMEAKYVSVATIDPATNQRREPNVLPNPTRNAEFLATQLQSAGYFQLADDQALVVTINPGNAGYFTVPVTNDWTITDNYWDEQTSLNIAQALPNCVGTVCDGTYTLVISPTDPHVANWISTGGLNQGTISIRFQDLDTTSSTLPTVSSQVVPLDQLATVLPPGTVYLTPAQRAEQLALRKAGFDNRFAPYPQP